MACLLNKLSLPQDLRCTGFVDLVWDTKEAERSTNIIAVWSIRDINTEHHRLGRIATQVQAGLSLVLRI